MKHVDEYRDPEMARRLLDDVRRLATHRWRIMDVCGGQTHSLLKYGIEDAVADTVELIHGPGCPVCVTPARVIDDAGQLSLRPNTVVMTFGDMLRVPGTTSSLAESRTAGGHIRTVYTPLDATRYALENPQENVVFLAVGFETTMPATALAIRQADRHDLRNFSILSHHVRVLPAMRQLMLGARSQIDAFLAAGHVCTITGFDEYDDLSRDFGIPVVITGFEPLDLLAGLQTAIQLLERGEVAVTNAYARSVRPKGNETAQRLIDDVFEVIDQQWRGLGMIARSGFGLRQCWSRFDARHCFGLAGTQDSEPSTSECRSGQVLQGIIKPHECPSFGTRCRPERPLGAPMVSSEGACAAYYRYRIGSHSGAAPP